MREHPGDAGGCEELAIVLPEKASLTANDEGANAGAVGLDGAKDEPLGGKVEGRDTERADGEVVEAEELAMPTACAHPLLEMS